MSRLGKAGIVAAVIVAALGGVYYYLFLGYRTPVEGTYVIDLAEARRLAATMPGAKPVAVTAEAVSTIYFPGAIVAVGNGWGSIPIVIYSFAVKYPDGHALIDTALDYGLAGQMGFDFEFDQESYDRMRAAMQTASLIVLTHEHMDHIGGLAVDPDMAALLPTAMLTREQVDHPEKMMPAAFPEGAFADYEPLEYDRYRAVAPGMVLIKAAGHSPGSQMVFVQLRNGQEYLFVGDIAWHMDSIRELRPRPRIISDWFLEEDRQTIVNQLAAIKALMDTEPNLAVVVAHDKSAFEALEARNLIRRGFD